jgi:hypothetical protein
MARRREAWKRQGASGALSAKRASLLRDAVERFTLLGPWPGGLDPVVDPLAKAYADRRKELQETSRRAYREYGKAMEQFAESQRPAALACKGDACKRVEEAVRRESCSQGRAMGDKIRPSAQAYDTAARVYFRESHRRASAAASYFSNPSYQQWVKARLEAHRLTAFGDILHTLHDDYTAPLAGVNGACKAQGTGNGPDQDQGAFPEFCELVPKGAKVKAELFVEVAVSCEEVQVGVNVGEPAGAFLEVSYGFTNGDITVFGGGQAEGSYGVGSAGTKVGGYITIDSSGNVSEVGVKSEASVSAGVAVGPASVGVEFSSEAVLINSSGTGVWQRGG